VHSIKKTYQAIYLAGGKIPKRDKLGIHGNIEHIAIGTMRNILHATFAPRQKKNEILEEVRISLEVLKHLIRIEYELKIIPEKTYIEIASLLIETSKMTNGWIKYIMQNPAR